MNKRVLAGASLLAVGVALGIWGVATDQINVALLLILPIVYGSSFVAAGAIFATFVGIVLLMTSLFGGARVQSAEIEAVGEPRRPRSGGVLLVGPIPIVWGSDWRWASLALALALALVLVVLAVMFLR